MVDMGWDQSMWRVVSVSSADAGVGGRGAAGVPPGSHPASIGWARACL